MDGRRLPKEALPVLRPTKVSGTAGVDGRGGSTKDEGAETKNPSGGTNVERGFRARVPPWAWF